VADENLALEGDDAQVHDAAVAQTDDTPEPIANLARDLGWTPKEEWHGEPDKWKPAEQFIVDGHEIQRSTAKELREMRQTLDAVSRTSASIVEQQLAEKRRELEQLHAQAVDEGDNQTAFKIASDIQNLRGPQKVVPGIDDWKSKNPWFGKDRAASARAAEICDRLAAMGVPEVEQLPEVERMIRKEYPELFSDQQRAQPASVRQPGARTAVSQSRAKGFHDMPAEAQKVAKDMVDRGVIPNVDAYTKQYWLSVGRKA
jgi:hypothetical protein